MALRTESRITIAGSVPEVWAYVCDVGRWPEWAPGVLECRVRGQAPLQPGARVEQRAKGIFGSTRNRTQDVTAVEAPAESEVYVPERYVRAWLDAGLIAVHPTV